MYDNVSQKLKSFTKVLTVILLVLIPAGGITGGILLLLAEAPIGYVIASVLGSAVLALLVYYGSCFAYGLAELLEQQTIATSLLRQMAHSNQSAVQQTRQEPAAPTYPLRQTGPGPRQPMQPPAAPQPEPCAGAYPYAKPQYTAIRSRVRMFRTRPSIGLRRPMARLRVLTKNSVTNRSADTRRKK